MSLHATNDDVPKKYAERKGEKGKGKVMTQRVFGNNVSVETALREPGYHSTPHQHEAEQINYVLEGEIWFFVEDQGFLCKKGDFSRIPAGKIHWAWNRSNQNSLIIEAHSPSQIGENAGAKAVGLYDDKKGEKPDVKAISTNRHSPECLVYNFKATEDKYGLHDDAKAEA